MFREAATMIAAPSAPTSEISVYITTLGGVAAVSRLLEVSQQVVRRWLQGREEPSKLAMFFLDEAYCAAVVAPSVDDVEILVP